MINKEEQVLSDRHDKDHIDEFIEAQENQYVQWKYRAANQPTPFDEAKGNAKLLGILYCFVSLLNASMGFFTFWLTKDIKVLLLAFALAALGVIVAIRYFQKHKERKAYAKKQTEINKSKRGKKRKTKSKK